MDKHTSQRRLALFAFFFLPGLSMASWVTRTPAIRDSIDASIAEMGMVLFGLSIGSMSGILFSGPLVNRYGSKPITGLGSMLVTLAMFTIALGVLLGYPWLVGLGLLFFGLGMGMAEIAINIDGADVERITGNPLMHSLHGFFSCGTVCGSLIGLALTAISVPVTWHLSIVGAINIGLLLVFMPKLVQGIGIAPLIPERQGKTRTRTSSALLDCRLYMLGIIVMAVALAEGAANDWLPIMMVDEYAYSQTSGSLVFLAFASTMTIGRFSGGYFLKRFGRVAVIRSSALLGACGLAIIIFGENALLAGLAVVLWGLGTSLGFPVALTAAGESEVNPAGRVKLVAMGGYIAFLVGPPLLGFIGEGYTLRIAMLVVLLLVLIAAVIASAVRPPEHDNGSSVKRISPSPP